jgi:hypothetical protein
VAEDVKGATGVQPCLPASDLAEVLEDAPGVRDLPWW